MKCTDKMQPEGYTAREWSRIQAKEAEEKKKQLQLFAALIGLLALVLLMAFLVYYFVIRSHDYTLFYPYSGADPVFSAGSSLSSEDKAVPFAQDLCVVSGDTSLLSAEISASSAGVFDINRCQTLYAKDVFTSRSPASITKVMTALVTLKYGNLDDIVTVTATASDIEYGSSVCDIKEGDVFSLRQLLYGMMVASGNDASMMIAEHVGGSVAGFVEMMNEEAAAIGAVDTHFVNPHGLTAEDHYTSAYDIYLIFQEAMKYDLFQDIIGRKNYYAEYTRADGTAAAMTWESTNHYFTNEAEAPDDVIVCGGKTGTTDDAGACLALLAKDRYGNPYLSIILHSDSKDTLYAEMNQLLSMIPA